MKEAGLSCPAKGELSSLSLAADGEGERQTIGYQLKIRRGNCPTAHVLRTPYLLVSGEMTAVVAS